MAERSETPLRRLLTNLVAPATVSTAVLYYFGWLRSQTIAAQFGYDASLLGLSTQDYILRSVQPVGTLAVVAGLLAWPSVVGHRWLSSRRQANELGSLAERRFTDPLLSIGLVAMAIALVWTWVGFNTAGYLLPLLCAFAAVGIGYGSWLRGPSGTRLAPEVVWAITVLSLAALFILTSVYARESGLDQAERNIDRARTSAVVTVTTAESLNLSGLPERRVEGGRTVTGLSLMFTSGGYHFLLPRDFDRDTRARVHTVPVEGSRLDFDASWEIPCVGFEDVPVGATFTVGETFSSAGVHYRIGALPGEDQDEDAGEEQEASESTTGLTVEADGAGGRRLHLTDATLSPEFGASYNAWLLDFNQSQIGVIVGADDLMRTGETLVALAEADALAPVANLVTEGGSDGRIRFRGRDRSLIDLTIGGTELMLDCPMDP